MTERSTQPAPSNPSAQAAASLTVTDLEGAPFGAEIVGLDPKHITESQKEVIWDAYKRRHGLICFSFDRLLEADELHALTAVFGENEFAPGKINGIGKGLPKGQEHVTVEEQVAEMRARGEDPYMAFIGNLTPDTLEAAPVDDSFYGEWEWHSDMSYIEAPPHLQSSAFTRDPRPRRRHGLLQPSDGGRTPAGGAATAPAHAYGEARLHLRQQWRPSLRHVGAGIAD